MTFHPVLTRVRYNGGADSGATVQTGDLGWSAGAREGHDGYTLVHMDDCRSTSRREYPLHTDDGIVYHWYLPTTSLDVVPVEHPTFVPGEPTAVGQRVRCVRPGSGVVEGQTGEVTEFWESDDMVTVRVDGEDRTRTTYAYRWETIAPEGAAAAAPAAPVDELEAFKRKVIDVTTAKVGSFGLSHADMMDYLTNDLGLTLGRRTIKVRSERWVVEEHEVEVDEGLSMRQRREAARAALGLDSGASITVLS